MLRALLQCRDDVLLVSDRGDHDDTRFRIVADDAFGSFDAFHLRHRDVHQYHIGTHPIVLGDRGAAVAGLAGYLAAEGFHHLRNVLAREDRVVHDQITQVAAVFFAESCELLHNCLLTDPPGMLLLPLSLAARIAPSGNLLKGPARPHAGHGRARLPPSAYRTPHNLFHPARW